MSVGGIYHAAGECCLTNRTVAFNSGMGIRAWADTKLINTLLAENSPGGNSSGAMTDLGHNLSSDLTGAFTNAGSMNNTYPLLGTLTNNGGATLTVALLPGCRAIDAGDTAAAPPTDQRGVTRPFGIAADIGAYEFNEATNPGFSAVVTECTEVGLRTAMSGGGRVTFACDGTITLSNTVVITANTLLDAANHQITLQGNGARLFQVGSDVTFSLADLVISGTGIQNTGGFVNATNCVFARNVAASGGAIENGNGEACLSACVFTNNFAAGWGGALDNGGTLLVDLCTFVANSAAGTAGSSGTGYGGSGGSGGDAAGGAIRNLGTLRVSRSTFTTNFVVAGAGGSGSMGHHGDPAWTVETGAAGARAGMPMVAHFIACLPLAG